MTRLQFHVKEICWSPYEQRSPILLQDKNGPCPLIALVNTLILTNDVENRTIALQESVTMTDEVDDLYESNAVGSSSRNMEKHRRQNSDFRLDISELRKLLNSAAGSSVEIAQILSCLGDLLLDIPTLNTSVVYELLEMLPLLHTGLDVNPNLTNGGFSSSEIASQIFSAFGLNFVHGWYRESDGNTQVDSIFETYQTFEGIQDYLLTSAEKTTERTQVKAWMRENGSQLTEAGLCLINQKMSPDSLAIFFRNNHFSTLYKAAENNGLYLLLTDEAFLKRPTYVWQSINSVSGNDDLYFTGDFTPLMDETTQDEAGVGTDETLLLAKQLQEKEDSAYAKILQSKYEKQTKRGNNSVKDMGVPISKATEERTDKIDKRPHPASIQSNKSKKKDQCVVM